MRTVLRWMTGVFLLVGITACGADEITTPAGPQVELEPDRTTAPGQLFLYNSGGLNRSSPGSPCMGAGPYRDFDFWLGEWEVFGPAGGTAGTNHILELLDGCVVEENWTGASGFRGRSMNVYDAATGTWSQYWMDQGGTHIRIEGGLQGDQMVMSGSRLLFTQNGLVPIVERITWTPLANGDVNQFWDVSVDGGSTFPFIFFNGTYVNTPGVQPAPTLQSNFCSNPEYRELDFLIGDWSVSDASGPLGTAVVATDLRDCIVEEDFSTGRGFDSQSFFGWDFTTETWYRAYTDSEGVRLVLSGGLVNGSMVLEGERPRAGNKTLHVRVTLTPDGPDTVTQSWETSRDGVKWKDGASVVFTRM